LFADNLGFLAHDKFGNFIDSPTARLFTLGKAGFGMEINAFRLRAFNVSLHAVRGRTHLTHSEDLERRDTEVTNERKAVAERRVELGTWLVPSHDPKPDGALSV
jgi:hypothetical protein